MYTTAPGAKFSPFCMGDWGGRGLDVLVAERKAIRKEMETLSAQAKAGKITLCPVATIRSINSAAASLPSSQVSS